MTPTFHYQILENYAPVMSRNIKIMLKHIESKLENGRCVVKDVRPLLVNYSLDVILETAMGIKMDVQKNWFELQRTGNMIDTEKTQFTRLVATFAKSVIGRALKPWLYPELIFRLSSFGQKCYENVSTMHNFTRNIIQQRKEEFLARPKNQKESDVDNEVSGKKRLAFLDLLMSNHLENPDQLDLKSMVEEVTTFTIAGTDSTSTALKFCLLLIGLHPEKQKLIHEELDSIFGDDFDREMNAEDFKRMSYLEMCIKESMRLYPPVAVFGRKVTETYQCGKSTVPAGCTAIVLTQAIHSDPNAFKKPQHFIPERFITGNNNFSAYTYIPFSAGPRNCIGQRFAMLEVKTVLANILKRFQIRSLINRDEVFVTFSVALIMKTPLPMEFIKRSSNISNCFSQ